MVEMINLKIFEVNLCMKRLKFDENEDIAIPRTKEFPSKVFFFR